MNSYNMFTTVLVLLLVVADLRSHEIKENVQTKYNDVNTDNDNGLDGTYKGIPNTRHKENNEIDTKDTKIMWKTTASKVQKENAVINAKDKQSLSKTARTVQDKNNVIKSRSIRSKPNTGNKAQEENTITRGRGLQEIKEIMSHICKEDYKLCDKRENEMNIFTDTSPCDNCSCHPIYCQISNNCCPDVELQALNDVNDVLPVCMELNDIIATIKSTVDTIHTKNNKSNNARKSEQRKDQTNNRKISSELANTKNQDDLDDLTRDNHDNFEDIQTKSLSTGEIPISYNQEHMDDSYIPSQGNIGEDDQNDQSQPSRKIYNINNQINIDGSTEHIDENIEDQTKRQASSHLTHFNKQNYKDDSTKLTEDINSFNDDIEAVDHNVKTKTDIPKFLVIDKCPKLNDTNIDTKVRCESKESLELIDYIPVSDYDYSHIYRNIWCAQCNNVKWVDKWRLETNCMNLYEHYILPSSVGDFLKLFTDCVGYLVPLSDKIQSSLTCRERKTVRQQYVPYQVVLISSCNNTRNGVMYNSTVQELCEGKNSLPQFVETTNTSTSSKTSRLYKNIFCYLCNTRDIARKHRNNINYDNPGIYLRENRINMNIEIVERTKYIKTDNDDSGNDDNNNGDDDDDDNDDDTSVKSDNNGANDEDNDDGDVTCLSGYIPDQYSNECIPFRCPVYQVSRGNQCVNKDTTTRGVVISSTILVSFTEGTIKLEDTDEAINQYGQYLNTVINSQVKLDINKCKVKTARMLANYTDIEKRHVNQIYMQYKIANTQSCSVKKIITILDKLYTSSVKTDINAYNDTISRHRVNKRHKIMLGLAFNSLYNTHVNITLVNEPSPSEITLVKTFNCPSIQINVSYYNELIDEQILSNTTDNTIDNTMNKTTALVTICYQTYISQWYRKQYKQQHQIPTTDIKLSASLSFYSTIVSITSIILVLVTYFLFPDLRYLPGKLFMMLCFNLLIAQVLFTFGIKLDVRSGWCTFTGMLIHLFWLATIFSMNSNLILLYSNVQKPLNARSQEVIHMKSNCTVYKYIVYIYTMSISCVLTNIILSSVLFHDKHYGYGGSFCYISTPIMRTITFTLPLMIVLIVNFGMFVYITCNVSHNIFKRHCVVFKSYVQLMLKLSTITGIFWLFGYLYQITGIKLLEYIFTVLNAGQGFFLMVSFLVNRRVFQLYRNLIYLYVRKEIREQLVDSSV